MVLTRCFAVAVGCDDHIFKADWIISADPGCQIFDPDNGQELPAGALLRLSRTASSFRQIAPAHVQYQCGNQRYQATVISGCGELCEGLRQEMCNAEALVAEDWKIALRTEDPLYGSFIECTSDKAPAGFAATEGPRVFVERLP